VERFLLAVVHTAEGDWRFTCLAARARSNPPSLFFVQDEERGALILRNAWMAPSGCQDRWKQSRAGDRAERPEPSPAPCDYAEGPARIRL